MSVSVIVRDVIGGKCAETLFYNPLSLIKNITKLEYEYVFQFNLKIHSVRANAYTYIPAGIKPTVFFFLQALQKTNCQNKDQKIN